MKPTTLFAAAAAGLFLSSVSCERHSWEETKALHEQHGAHGEHAAHSDDKHHAEEGHGHSDEEREVEHSEKKAH